MTTVDAASTDSVAPGRGEPGQPQSARLVRPPAVPANLAELRCDGTHSPDRQVRPELSVREVEVLLAWLECDSKEGAARRLFIAGSTVSTHLARIRAKYAAVGRPAPTKTHLLARALQDGLTNLDRW